MAETAEAAGSSVYHEIPPVLFAASMQHELESRDEWDPETKLFQLYEVEQGLLPEVANCIAVQAYMKMLKLTFSIEERKNAEHMSPNGKVPFIKCGQFVISELEPIVNFAQSKGHSLTKDLDKRQLSDMRAYMCLVDSVLGKAETYTIWCDPNVLPLTEKRYGSVYPFPLNHWLTFLKKRASRKRLEAYEWLNKSYNEVCEEVDTCCKALSARLGESPYFFDKPTELDALLFGHVFTVLTTELPTNKLATIVSGYSNLINHCKNIEEHFFPRRK